MFGVSPWLGVPAKLPMLFTRCRDAVRDAQGRDALDQVLMLLPEILLLEACMDPVQKRLLPSVSLHVLS